MWLGIIGGSITISKFLEIPNKIIVFIMIIVILVLLIYKKDKKIEYLEKRLPNRKEKSNYEMDRK